MRASWTGTVGPAITLALASTMSGAQIQKDGSAVQTIDNTLAYVFTWTDVPCVPKGVGAPPTTTSTTFRCTLIDLVDANSGSMLLSVEATDP
jgi:hypothetical protein